MSIMYDTLEKCVSQWYASSSDIMIRIQGVIARTHTNTLYSAHTHTHTPGPCHSRGGPCTRCLLSSNDLNCSKIFSDLISKNASISYLYMHMTTLHRQLDWMWWLCGWHSCCDGGRCCCSQSHPIDLYKSTARAIQIYA